MLNIIFETAVLILFIRGVSTLIFLLQSFEWLKRNKEVNKNSKAIKSLKLYILIPALKEQKRIVKTLDYFVKNFSSENIKTIVITTQREFENNFKGQTTREIVLDFIKRNKLSKKIVCIDYPDKKGVMAHQLNFALNSIDDGESFVAIYNADSRPHSKTVELLSDQISKHPEAVIFQQSAAFVKNYDEMTVLNHAVTLFLKTSAILQTRWTFAHEFPRLMRQSVFNNSILKKYANAHVVGHGLFIKTAVLKEVGGFPTQNITEDLFLGYILRSKGYSIYPLPLLELADSPTSTVALWKQKYVWFWGPMKYIVSSALFLHNLSKRAGLETSV